jgi:hypothetical protein
LSDLVGFRRLHRRLSNKLFNYGFPSQLSGGEGVRRALIRKSLDRHWEILWLEKALDIDSHTISMFKERCPDCLIIGFSPDDMYARHCQSQHFLDSIHLYDRYITTKSFNLDELRRLGCPKSIFMANGYDSSAFRPIEPTSFEKVALGGDIGFIGSYETDRSNQIRYLAHQGFSVRVWGDGWQKISPAHNLVLEHMLLLHKDFPKACNSFKINLNFLRKINRDLQTTRSVEIPACRGFMLAERTTEHQELFTEGLEAEFFSSKEELVDKCKFYLKNDTIRDRIAQAGYDRCTKSGYSNVERLKSVFDQLLPC